MSRQDDWRIALERVEIADRQWTRALERSEQAPPDAGFPDRLRDIADASEQEAGALRLADSLGLGWSPAQGARTLRLSYELRPGANRPGPQALWDRFDRAVAALGEAMEGVAMSAVSRCFGELSELARELADTLEGKREGEGERARSARRGAG